MNNNFDYFTSQKRKFEEDGDADYKEANEVFRELVRQLILVGSVILPISFFVFNSKDLSNTLTPCNKWVLIFSWILILLSIFCGIVQLIIDHLFFAKWGDTKWKIVQEISRDPGVDINAIADKYQSNIPNKSATKCLILQIIFIMLGIISLIFIMSKALLNM